jgi:hypothetical protein
MTTKTAGIGKHGQDNQDRTAMTVSTVETGHLGHDIRSDSVTIKPGQASLDTSTWTGQRG